MRYQEYYPKPPLRRFIECFWTLESTSTSELTQPERILPDGCVELILNFGDRFSQHQPDKKITQPSHFLVGQMTGPILISPTGIVELIGIRFHPGGTSPFFRFSLAEITDQVVELGSIAASLERELLAASTHLRTTPARVTAIEQLLLKRALSSKHDSSIVGVAEKIVDAAGVVSVDVLAGEAGISTRQLERRFLREVGIGPKLLSRILRFQQVFRAVEACEGEWAPVAIECGYYDQAHLIRDFNQFARQTPAVLFAEHSALTESFTRKTRTSNFSNTVI